MEYNYIIALLRVWGQGSDETLQTRTKGHYMDLHDFCWPSTWHFKETVHKWSQVSPSQMCHLGRKVVAGALVFFDPKSHYRSWLSFWLSSFHASHKVHAGHVLFYTTGFQTTNMLSQRKVNSKSPTVATAWVWRQAEMTLPVKTSEKWCVTG